MDEVRDQHRATVIAAVELRKTGRKWQIRKGVAKRLGFDPAQQDSEGEEDAVAAGRAMRERQRALLPQIPELPDRYDPTEARPPSRTGAPSSKGRRVRLESTSDAEDTPPAQPDNTPFRIESDSEAEFTQHTYDPVTQVVVDMLELEGPRVNPVVRSGPSHGGEGLPAPPIQDTQRRFSSDDDEWVGPRLGLVRKGRGGGRPVRKHARRRAANPFVQFEAEEGDDEESASESSPRRSPPHASHQTSSPTHTQTHSSDSEESDSSSELNDSFVVADDCFE